MHFSLNNFKNKSSLRNKNCFYHSTFPRKLKYKSIAFTLTLQSSKPWIVCLLIFEVNQDSLGDVILLTSHGVSFTEVQEGLNTFESCFPWKTKGNCTESPE